MDGAPGLTCLWQVKKRRNKITFDEWARLDIRYLRKRSVWLDLKLIAKTFWVVLRREGI
jgi:lipopolysaccharide/colanic/teichoic acid biosynthesis glycosyltransferase